MNAARVVCSALALGILAAPALADRDSFRIDYYTVTGSTVEELRRELNARGPIGESGHRSEGNTRSQMRWSYDFVVRNGICITTQTSLDVEIRMTLPRWEHPDYLNYVLTGHWDRYSKALRKHEDGHRYRAEATAREIRRVLAAEPGEKDCQALQRRLDAKAGALLASLRLAQARYDSDTDNGAKQGVWLPESLPAATGGR
jgi:predicted secreted Zn-dependent protease